MLPTQTQEDALYILNFGISAGKSRIKGGELEEYFQDNHLRGLKAFNLLKAHNCIRERIVPYGSGGSDNWKIVSYDILPEGYAFLDKYQSGNDPFRQTAVQHGNNYYNRFEGNQQGIAIGDNASVTINHGVNASELKELFNEMALIIRSLPPADKDDGEYQLSKLAEAAEKGQDAVEERQGSFMRFVTGLQSRVETAQAYLALYRVAVLLFGVFGFTIPGLPDGL